jgi:DNA-binding NarL/FixJ family response regulator
MKTIRILLVDDDAMARRGVSFLLSLEPDIDVVGEASDGSQAVEAARTLDPDIVLMDLHMRDVNGFSAAHELHEHTDAAVIMLSMRDDPAARLMARAAGATAYVGKHEVDTHLVDAIRTAAGAA